MPKNPTFLAAPIKTTKRYIKFVRKRPDLLIVDIIAVAIAVSIIVFIISFFVKNIFTLKTLMVIFIVLGLYLFINFINYLLADDGD
tara:strand:- start:202 stop:459 length:258 start_codon:yes stop_codon:yes gene_type:complete